MGVSTNNTHMSVNISVQHKDHSTSLHKTSDDGNNNKIIIIINGCCELVGCCAEI